MLNLAKSAIRHQWMPLAISGFTIVLYFQACSYSFTNWDEHTFLLQNPLLRGCSLGHAAQLFIPGSIPDELLYIPVSYLSLLVEVCLFGLNPAVFHTTNILLHVVNSVLVFTIFNHWQDNRLSSFLASLLFSVHPLQIEAVAWIMGRKDLLSTCFALLSMLLYQKSLSITGSRYPESVKKCRGSKVPLGERYKNCILNIIRFSKKPANLMPADATDVRKTDCLQSTKRFNIAAFAFLVGAILSKPTMIVLSVILLLMTIFKNGRLMRRDWLFLAPCFMISVLGYFVNHSTSYAGEGIPVKHILRQCLFLPTLIAEWIGRLLLIQPPSVLYRVETFFSVDNPSIVPWLPFLLVAVLLIRAIYSGDSQLTFGILFATTACMPAFSILIFMNREFVTADRYSYFPVIPVFFVVVVFRQRLEGQPQRLYTLLLCIWIVGALIFSSKHLGIWKNSESLWSYVIQHDVNNATAYNLLGNYYNEQHDISKAEGLYLKAIKANPKHIRAHYNLGRTYSEGEQFDKAAEHYIEALKIDSGFVDAYTNLGAVYFSQDKPEAALAEFSKALKNDPENVPALYNSGLVYNKLNKLDSAIDAFEKALIFNPDHTSATFKLAIVYHKRGLLAQAEEAYIRSLIVAPDNAKCYYNLALILLATGRPERALEYLKKTQQPGDFDIIIQSGIAYMRMKRYGFAINAYKRALVLNPENAFVHRELCLAHYYSEKYEEALFHLFELEKRKRDGIRLDPEIVIHLKNQKIKK